MDPDIHDILKITLSYHLTRFLADGIYPPEVTMFLKMEDRQNYISRYGRNMFVGRTVATVINRFSGEDNEITRQFELDNPDIVKQAVERICTVQQFRDFLSWYVDCRVSDGLPQCKRRAEDCGLYVGSSLGKDQLRVYMKGVSNAQVSNNSTSGGNLKGNGCLIPIALIGVPFIGTIMHLTGFRFLI